MVLQDGEGSVERRLQRLLGVLTCCLKVPVQHSLNDAFPLPLRLGPHGPGEQGIESVLQQRLKRLLRCLLHWLLLLLLLWPAQLTCRLYLRLELFAHRPRLLLDLLPHGLPEVLVELCQNRLERLRLTLLTQSRWSQDAL